MRRGEVTAFLTLIFVLLVSFITAMLDASAIKTAGNLKRAAADRALFSLFGEYHRELLETYDIFAVDTSFGTGSFKEKNITDRLCYYGDGDIRHTITGIQYLTDEDGIGFREQALSYMESAYGLGLISGFVSQTGKWEELKLEGEAAREREEDSDRDFNEALETAQEEAREEAREEEPPQARGNPLAALENVKPAYILSAVLPDSFQVSGRRVDPKVQPSGRELKKGRGAFKNRTDLYALNSKLLFHEFLLKKFSCALDPAPDPPKGEGALSYELEYMIGKKASDNKNLEAVARKILLLRIGANMLCLESDGARKSKAGSVALTVCTLLCIPAAQEAAKQLLLLAWAYKESMADLAVLFSGKKLSLIKKKEQWQTAFAEILSPVVHVKPKILEGESGYRDFLRILFSFEDEKALTMRAIDCVEQELRFSKGQKDFRADGSMIKLKTRNEADIGRGLTYTFPGSFCYL